MNAALDATLVRRLLTESGVKVQGELSVQALTGGRSNLTYKVHDGRSTWVVRRPPTSGLTASAHDMAREFTVTAALQSSTVPVARTIACDPDGTTVGCPVSVVEYVPGLAIRDQDELAALSDEQARAVTESLIRTLVDLHSVDYRSVGLEAFGRPDGFLARQAAVWARQWQRVKTRELGDIERLATTLAERLPTSSGAAIVHGDFRIDNTLLDPRRPEKVLAVVDWEMSTIGDPLTDIALACVYRSPAFDLLLGTGAAWTSDRLPSADDIAHLYSTVAGRPLTNWNCYLALANLKVAVIAEGISYRARLHTDDDPAALLAADAAPAFAAAGLTALRAG
ncbi:MULTISPECIES: phosphotransferase family protein [unclassified Mycolicibacterium]|uniref:phosphotransferase family protein n=1 Tax=unclassified Mycolicibacterium TaxID=2636767 RepID=UPI0012DC1022|nr:MULTISPECIES: phosphotransferase family protein [unclassified Mycolicibacterium]MUL82118.1 phosphotransferase family protein [Mycolicibacterium sp. CBMA 329]MUL87884.1 phosphotransferase family protein [Mycolicibacterium sp. CBMA 331]MUM01707.1 phosphotransferase family protein [Mycolicibacterium sp. CBMA 334]MUM38181.1 phosphotransferase family protein [Mycolicibacterium sp. CBMA 247]MUM43949.1 phosphotransferase family protein [Mycolicibacterium sp. CBMA 294]